MGMVTREEFEKMVESRLVKMDFGFQLLYPNDESEIHALERIGYEIIGIGKEDGKTLCIVSKMQGD